MPQGISPEMEALLKIARERVGSLVQAEKQGFVDPAMASGAPPAGAMPPGGDPMAGGGMADPMAGAMPPMPAMGGADPAAGLTEERVMQMIQEAVGGGAAGAAGAAGAGPEGKKKVDVNTEIYHIKKLLIHMMTQLQMEIPPTTLLGDPAEDPQSTPEEVSADPASAGAAPQSAIQPIQAMQGASLQMAGESGGEAAPPKAAADRQRPVGGYGLLGVAGQAAAAARVLEAGRRG